MSCKDKGKHSLGEIMKTFKEYLKEAQQINYDLHDIRVIRKRNIEAARDILQNNKDIIPDINNAKNVSQFDTEEQRDAVVAAYILNTEQPEYAKQIGIDIQNPKNFDMMVKDEIIDPTRTAAKETGKKNPSMQEVKAAGQPKTTEKEQETETEAPRTAEKAETPEEPTEAPEQPTEEPDDEEPDDSEDGEEKFGPGDTLDKEEYPAPKSIVKEIDKLRADTINKIKEKLPEDPTREQKATLDRLVTALNKKLDGFRKTADAADRGYSVNPTPMSMRRASTKASDALSRARTEATKYSDKAVTKQLSSGVTRMLKRGVEVGKKVVDKAKQAAQSRPAQILKQEGGRALKQTGAAIKRGAEVTKAATERAVSNITQNTTAKMISQELGTKRAQEYIGYLRNGEEEKAEALASQAAQSRQKKQAEAKYNRMDQRVQGSQDKAIRQAAAGKGGARATAIAKKVTDKFRRPASRTTPEEEQRRA